jgi:hypothetical protein
MHTLKQTIRNADTTRVSGCTLYDDATPSVGGFIAVRTQHGRSDSPRYQRSRHSSKRVASCSGRLILGHCTLPTFYHVQQSRSGAALTRRSGGREVGWSTLLGQELTTSYRRISLLRFQIEPGTHASAFQIPPTPFLELFSPRPRAPTR